eukprot:882148-Amphidinium_carterae.1
MVDLHIGLFVIRQVVLQVGLVFGRKVVIPDISKFQKALNKITLAIVVHKAVGILAWSSLLRRFGCKGARLSHHSQKRSLLPVPFVVLVMVQVKITRVVKMFRFLTQLRVMVAMILTSLSSLFWLFVLLFLMVYVCAVVLTQGRASTKQQFQ